jgi:hypothetical protein
MFHTSFNDDARRKPHTTILDDARMDLLHDTVVCWLVRFVADSGVRCWLLLGGKKNV